MTYLPVKICYPQIRFAERNQKISIES
jgi:hypothetical protein